MVLNAPDLSVFGAPAGKASVWWTPPSQPFQISNTAKGSDSKLWFMTTDMLSGTGYVDPIKVSKDYQTAVQEYLNQDAGSNMSYPTINTLFSWQTDWYSVLSFYFSGLKILLA